MLHLCYVGAFLGLVRIELTSPIKSFFNYRKDLRKPKWESMSTEVNYLKNDVIGCLRDVREWSKPKKAEKSIMTLLDDCVIRFGFLRRFNAA